MSLLFFGAQSPANVYKRDPFLISFPVSRFKIVNLKFRFPPGLGDVPSPAVEVQGGNILSFELMKGSAGTCAPAPDPCSVNNGGCDALLAGSVCTALDGYPQCNCLTGFNEVPAVGEIQGLQVQRGPADDPVFFSVSFPWTPYPPSVSIFLIFKYF